MKMKNLILLCFGSAFLLGASAFWTKKGSDLGTFKLENRGKAKESGAEKARNAKEAMKYRFDLLKDENGNFDPTYYANAIVRAKTIAQSGSRSGLGLQWEELGPDNIGGRTRAILIDNRDASNNTVYAGGVGGGMWKSTDGAHTWNRLTGWNEWLAVSCIAQGSDGKIYVGTGEGLAQIAGTSFNSGSLGNGVYMLDANDNPTRITPDNFPTLDIQATGDYYAVNRIAVNPTNPSQIIVATNSGLHMTYDNGANWQTVSINGLPNGSGAADVKWGKGGSVLYAAVGGFNKLAMSGDGGNNWSLITSGRNPGFPSGSFQRIEVAIAPSDPNVVYCLIAAQGGGTLGLYGTKDGANSSGSWSTLATKGPLFDPFTSEVQGWYDNVIAVNPINPDKVYLGGVDFYTYSAQSGAKLADAGLGSSATNPYYIHPDKHAITFCANDSNLMYVGCDGGIYKSTDAGSAFPFPTFQVSNRGYNVTQEYGVAAGINGEVMAGSQDNGTALINHTGNTNMAGQEVIGGDGIFTAISHIDPRYMFGGVYYADLSRSGNSGASFSGFYDVKVDPQGKNSTTICNGADPSGDAPFITPFYLLETKSAFGGLKSVPFVADRDYNAGEVVSLISPTGKYPFVRSLSTPLHQNDTVSLDDPIRSRMMVSSFCGVYLTSDPLNSAIIPRWFKLTSSITGIATGYAGTDDGDVLYVSTSSGYVYRFNHFNAMCDTTVYTSTSNIDIIYKTNANYTGSLVTGRDIEGIAVDPNDNNHVAVAVAGFSSTNQPHVYESTDGGQHWTPDTTGLPNMPVYGLVFHDSHTLVAGTELGIWSWNGSQWSEDNNGFPRMPVFRIIEKELFTDGCKVMYIGTHGRGMWRCTTLTDPACKTDVTAVKEIKAPEVTGLNIFPNPVNSGSKVAITLEKSADVTLRIFDLTGKVCRETIHRNAIAGENLFDLNATGLSAGNYLLAATVGNQRTQSRLFTVAK